jgi:hypothetical protein
MASGNKCFRPQIITACIVDFGLEKGSRSCMNLLWPGQYLGEIRKLRAVSLVGIHRPLTSGIVFSEVQRAFA